MLDEANLLTLMSAQDAGTHLRGGSRGSHEGKVRGGIPRAASWSAPPTVPPSPVAANARYLIPTHTPTLPQNPGATLNSSHGRHILNLIHNPEPDQRKWAC